MRDGRVSIGLWWVATKEAGVSDTLCLRRRRHHRRRRLYPLIIYQVVAGTTSEVNPTDGSDGWPEGCVVIVLRAYIGIHVDHRPGPA